MSNLDEEVDYVFEGNCFKDDKHLNDLRRKFFENLESNAIDIESDINACRDELERIQVIKKLFRWIPVTPCYFERFQKSPDTSSKLRDKANAAYKNGKYNEALRGYNLALVFAPLNSEELGLAYGNRSALFVQMKEPLAAIRDIKLSLMCPNSENLKTRLFDRQKKCNDLLLQNGIANAKVNSECQLIGKKFCDENVLRLKTPNPSTSLCICNNI